MKRFQPPAEVSMTSDDLHSRNAPGGSLRGRQPDRETRPRLQEGSHRGSSMNKAKSPGPPTSFLREIILDSNRDRPLHVQLRVGLERLIQERFENESRFYSESQLFSNLLVSQGTVRRALADLAQRGLLEKLRSKHTIVRKPVECGFRNLAVFLPDYNSAAVARLLNELSAECLNRGIRIQPLYTHRGERLLNAYNHLKFGPREGGVVLLENTSRATAELTVALGDKDYDCVVVGTVRRNSPAKFVGGRNASMVKLGLRHLEELGHRNIALLVNEPEEKISVQERIAAFEEWKSAAENLHAWVIRSGARLWDDAHEAASRALDAEIDPGHLPTAVFAVSDVGAISAINWFRKQGLRVPEDVSVIGIGGIDAGAMVHPALTTLADSFEEIADGIFHLFAERNPPVRQIYVEPKLVVRESTSAPRR